MKNRLRLVGCVLVLAAFGCSAKPSGVSDSITTALLSESKSGVAVLLMGVPGHRCIPARVGLAQRKGDSYEFTKSATMHPDSTGPSYPAEIELAAGEYHIVWWACETSQSRAGGIATNTLSISAPEGKPVGKRSVHKSSLASFTVSPGEIVNLGYVQIETLGQGRSVLRVTDMPAESLQYLAKTKPNLFRQMTTRSIKLSSN